jgi:hypothetical protein
LYVTRPVQAPEHFAAEGLAVEAVDVRFVWAKTAICGVMIDARTKKLISLRERILLPLSV